MKKLDRKSIKTLREHLVRRMISEGIESIKGIGIWKDLVVAAGGGDRGCWWLSVTVAGGGGGCR